MLAFWLVLPSQVTLRLNQMLETMVIGKLQYFIPHTLYKLQVPNEIHILLKMQPIEVNWKTKT